MANRSVYVDLGLRAEQYKTEADTVIGKTKEMDREVDKLDDDINKLGPDAAKAAAAVKLLGDEHGKAATQVDQAKTKVDNIGEAIKKADVEIERSKALISELAAEFGRTGDLDIVKKIGAEQSSLGRLERLRTALAQDLAAAMKTFGEETGSAATKVDNVREAIKNADAEIERSKTLLVELAAEFGRTGDLDIVKKIGAEQSSLGRLERLRTNLEGIRVEAEKLARTAEHEAERKAAEAVNTGHFLLDFALDEWLAKVARSTKAGLQDGLDSISGMAPTGFVQWLVAGAVAAAPAIGAAINAAVLLGLGGGALAAGIAGALQDPEVKATWSDFGDFLKSGLADAASSFVQPMEAAAVTLRGDLSQVFTVLSHDLDVLAPALTRVADGLGGFLVNMLPGLDNALQASGPLLTALGDELPRLGSTMSFFFDQIAQGGPGAVSFFKDLMTVTEATIGTLGIMTSTLSRFYDVFREGSIHDQLEASGLMGWLEPLVADIQKKKKADEDGAQAVANHRARMTDEAFAAQQAKMSIDQLSQAIDKEVSASLNAKNTHLAFNQALIDLHKSQQQNGKDLRDNTEAGIANQQAILKAAAAAEADRQSVLQQTGDVKKATGVFDDHMRQVYATAAALGFDKQQTDALIGSVKSIPHESTTDIQLKGANVAEDDIRTYKNYLSQIPTSVTTYVNTVHEDTNLGFIGQSYRPAPTGANRWGGLYEHAAMGTLREAGTFSAVSSGARYAFAEPATGGEAFIPRNGDYGRSMAILGRAASWYGASVIAGQGGGGRMDVTHRVVIQEPSGRRIAELVIEDSRNGGTAFNAYVRQVASR